MTLLLDIFSFKKNDNEITHKLSIYFITGYCVYLYSKTSAYINYITYIIYISITISPAATSLTNFGN